MSLLKCDFRVVGPIQTNCYFLYREDTKECLIIDPGYEADKIEAYVQKKQLHVAGILLTHGHFDHVEALKEVAEKYNAPIYMNKNEIDFMKNDKTVFGALPKKYNLVEDGDTLPFGDGVIKCIHTPGHTKGGMCYLYKDALFTGDTLFKGSVGRSDFIGGNFNELITSIKTKLMILDDNIKVYPGHMESSSIGFERLNNPFLKDEFDIF